MKGSDGKAALRAAAEKEWEALWQEMEQENPGYLEEKLKLTTMVLIFMGIRILYGIFYMGISVIYDLELMRAVFMIISAFIFYLWYSWMLKAGKGVAILMLVIRGISIVTGGVSILEMSYWLPFPLIFALTAACMMEFCEAIFCIYIMFNKTAAMTIRLNMETSALIRRGVSGRSTKRMAEYKNPYSGDITLSEEEQDGGTQSDGQQEPPDGGGGQDSDNKNYP